MSRRTSAFARRATVATVAGLAVLAFAQTAAARPRVHPIRYHRGDVPLVIGHRGAPGYRPEETLQSYALAAAMGADYLEGDLESTKDGVLVMRHDVEISQTTDVADHPEFASLKTTKTIDGVAITDWFVPDFTYAQLQTLRAKERLPAIRQHNTLFDGRYAVPTFQQVIDLSKRLSRKYHRRLGLYIETKHPTFYTSIGLSLEPKVIKVVRRNHLDAKCTKLFLQSFEPGSMKTLGKALPNVPVIQLIDSAGSAGDGSGPFADMVTPAGLAKIAAYADGIGPDKGWIDPRDATGKLLGPTSLVADAHRDRLLVHPFTFRAENSFLPLDFRSGTVVSDYGNAFAEDELFFRLGVDGIFTDNPDIGVLARGEFESRR